MKIVVFVKTKSSKIFVRQTDATHFEVSVNEPPLDGRANHAIQVALAKYLGVKRSDVLLIQGEKSKEKVFTLPLSADDLQVIYLDHSSS